MLGPKNSLGSRAGANTTKSKARCLESPKSLKQPADELPTSLWQRTSSFGARRGGENFIININIRAILIITYGN